MKLIPLPALADNYIWMLHDESRAVVVDPGDAQVVRRALQDRGLKLEAIVVTHHHPDHTDGIAELVEATACAVFGPAKEKIDGLQTRLSDGDRIQLLGLPFDVLEIPGHTAGHIAYFGPGWGDDPVLFCGDTLFSGGCGRLFEGTPAQMLASLTRLGALPANTQVCCTHEYTLSNLKFALAVEPTNTALQHYEMQCQAKRAQGRPTLPSSIALEQQINPFLRSHVATVAQAAHAHDAVLTAEQGVFACLRQWKNNYR